MGNSASVETKILRDGGLQALRPSVKEKFFDRPGVGVICFQAWQIPFAVKGGGKSPVCEKTTRRSSGPAVESVV